MSSDDEISEFIRDPVERAEEDSIENPAAGPRQRGPPKIPDLWTRVISFSTD